MPGRCVITFDNTIIRVIATPRWTSGCLFVAIRLARCENIVPCPNGVAVHVGKCDVISNSV